MIHMFNVPLFNMKCTDWQNKKNKLLKISDNIIIKNKDTVLTDYIEQNKFYCDQIVSIFEEELDIFCKESHIKHVTIQNAWFEIAEKNMYHGIHNHGAVGYSAVCFIEYDKELHEPTVFISPYDNFIDGSTLYYKPYVDEGTLIMFPSMVKHYTTPNKNDKIRKVVSFNINV